MSNRIQSILKFAITGLALAFIIFKISRFEDIGSAWGMLTTQLKEAPILFLVIVLIGVPLHWLFEIIKWHQLILTTYKLSFKKAIIGVISGMTMAIFTPNRVGEVFTRVFVLPKEKRSEGIALSGVNSLALFVIIQVFGLIGFALYLNHPEAKHDIELLSQPWIIATAIIISIALILGYFNLSWLKTLMRLVKIDQKYPGINQAFTSLTYKDKIKALVWSVAKYLTYTLQFYFLLKYLGIPGELSLLLPAIMTIYLLMNFLPVIPIGEAGVKGSITLLIIGQNSEVDLGILTAALLIWVLNIASPALLGSIFLRKIRF